MLNESRLSRCTPRYFTEAAGVIVLPITFSLLNMFVLLKVLADVIDSVFVGFILIFQVLQYFSSTLLMCSWIFLLAISALNEDAKMP